MELTASVIIGYLFGCINIAYLVAKIKGVNIKKVGTTNAGASNVFISVGKIYGVLAGAGDIFKAFFAALLVSWIFNDFNAGAIAGIMAVIGHIFPFWMKFNGGKGLASLMGVILFFGFGEFALFGIILIVITLISDYIALATLCVAAIWPFYLYFYKGCTLPIFILFLILGAIIWYKHSANIVRMKNGNEFGFLRKNKTNKEP